MRHDEPPEDRADLTRTFREPAGSTDQHAAQPPPVARLGDFEILRELGRGGMGVVYEAHQKSLDRRVALKVLPPALGFSEQAIRRFELEARAAARLQHRGIVGVHGIGEEGGQRYYAMELVDGRSLDHILPELARGKWSTSLDAAFTGERSGIDRAVVETEFPRGGRAWADVVASLIADVAEALDYAHGQGVVHRDIKPANLILSRQGHICITDFGLARLAQEPGMTMSGALVGTPAYMSPEQIAAGRMPLDHRTDIYSLGAVLYEMLTLERPFSGESRDEVIGGVLTKDPAEPRSLKSAIPQDLQTICLKALEKDPDRRYQTAGEMAGDLREYVRRGMISARPIGPVRRSMRFVRRHPTLTTAIVAIVLVGAVAGLNLDRWKRAFAPPRVMPDIKRLAVLPFRYPSGDAVQESYADGITEVLIADLGQIDSLRVIARRSVERYKDSNHSVSEIARELDVDAIVDGSVLRSGDRIRVTANLIDAATENQLWSDRYERAQKDTLLLQGEVALAIANQIRTELTPEEQALLADTRVVDPEAHEAYLIGKSFVDKWERQAVTKGIRYLEQALEHDPDHARALAGLSLAYVFSASPGGGWRSPDEIAEKARNAANRALELDESLAEAHTALGGVSMLFDWDVEAAEREFQRAIELNSNLADARNAYGMLLSRLGRHGEALQQVELLIQIDPLNPWYRAGAAQAHFFAGDFAKAYEQYERMLDLDPGPFFQALVHWARSRLERAEGRLEDALASLEQAVDLTEHEMPDMLASLGQVYSKLGRREDAARILDEMSALARKRYVSPYNFAQFHAGVGDVEAAFASLERAYELRCGYMFYLAQGFRSLRGDPRWDNLVERVGIPPPAA